MHGIGNDYVYVNGFEERLEDPADVARRVSDRHRGVGGDGLIIIQPPSSDEAHCRMEMYNADGSRAQMCGNGIRCVGKYVYDHGLSSSRELVVETDSGTKTLLLSLDGDGRVAEVEVNMGAPILERGRVPCVDGGDPDDIALDVPLEVDGQPFAITAVSTGNPHAVVRLDRSDGKAPPAAVPSVDTIPLERWGPLFESHPWFPERTNTEFVTVPTRRELEFRVWERGSGETLACGTGACAAVVAAVLNDWCDTEVCVHLRGGDLKIRWERSADGRGGDVFMTGAATEVFSGEFPLLG